MVSSVVLRPGQFRTFLAARERAGRAADAPASAATAVEGCLALASWLHPACEVSGLKFRLAALQVHFGGNFPSGIRAGPTRRHLRPGRGIRSPQVRTASFAWRFSKHYPRRWPGAPSGQQAARSIRPPAEASRVARVTRRLMLEEFEGLIGHERQRLRHAAGEYRRWRGHAGPVGGAACGRSVRAASVGGSARCSRGSGAVGPVDLFAACLAAARWELVPALWRASQHRLRHPCAWSTSARRVQRLTRQYEALAPRIAAVTRRRLQRLDQWLWECEP